ncbi:MAG: hypothetical protein NT161_00550 [Candidatus Nomurabacteria bacterium]|nr:hypothetical protein [Candidatus Nomurabacteria bacterium]
MKNSENKKIEIISSHTDVKESDKQEGIAMYGSKPLGEKEGGYVSKRTAEEIRREISELEKSWKSTNYVGDKSGIEKEITKLENELAKLKSSSNNKLKTAKELAMEGNIAWKKEDAPSDNVEKGTEETIKIEIEKKDKRLAELDEDDAKLREELKKSGMGEEEINNLLSEKTKEIKSVTKGQDIVDKKEIRENKEKYSREELLNAAEIFCKYNPAAYFNKSPEEQKIAEERALLELKNQHSEREINAAIKVAGKRNEMFGLKNRINRIKEEYEAARDNPNAEISTVRTKYDQQIENIKREMRLIDNDYNPLLRELKIANLDSQLKNLEKYRDHADYKEKVEDAELFALSMIQTETIRYQDAKISSNSIINPQGWDHVKNFFKRGVEGLSKNKLFKGYMGMGRGKRMALNAAMIGGATALWLPATVAAGASAVGFVSYKMARSLMGGTFGYYLSKKVFQPIVRKAYEHDEARDRREQQREALTSEEMIHFQELAKGEANPTEREKILQKIADKNIELCNKYAERIRRNKKYFIGNNILGTVAAGLVGGKAGQMTADWLAGPGVFGIFPAHGTGITKEVITDNNPHKGGAIPIPGEENIPKGGGSPGIMDVHPKTSGSGLNPDDLKAATVGKGEGIEHALRRQLEMHPDKFGFKGDLNDKIAVHNWSGGKADLIAIDQHYKGGGTETWVRDMGEPGPKGNPAYVLDVDASGKPAVHEFFGEKSSGSGGMNSPYEYSHESPVSQRYVSAIDNTPEQIMNESGMGPKVTNLEPVDLHTTHSNSEFVDTSMREQVGTEFVNPSTINETYNNNITHFFPDDPSALNNLKLTAKEVLRENISDINTKYQPFVSYLHKLEEVTKLTPNGRVFLMPAETVGEFMKRALQKVAEMGKLDEISF